MPPRRKSRAASLAAASPAATNAPTNDGEPSQPSGTSQPSQITPRNSITNDEAAAANPTPYNALRQLANLPRPTTPLARVLSAGPSGSQRSTRRTPAPGQKTPVGQRRPGSAKQPAAATPYGQAAIREREQRRAAALTPGKDRRRSGKQQREVTPRDGLRALSRILGPKTTVTESSPPFGAPATGKVATKGQDDDDIDEPELKRPRLSMPLDEDEDDSLLLPPVMSDLAGEDDFTQQSLEFTRRQSVERGGRLSRASFGSIRQSDRFDLSLDRSDPDEGDSSFIPRGNFDDDEAFQNLENLEAPMEATEDLRHAFNLDPLRRISTISGRLSDMEPEDLAANDETTFLLAVPEREPTPADESLLDIDRGGPEEADDIDEPDDEDEQQEDPAADLEPSVLETEENETMLDATMLSEPQVDPSSPPRTKRKRVKLSKYGIEYPSLPPAVVKKMAQSFLRTSGNSKAKINKDTLDAILQASDWFFEQAGEDLGAYAKHAGRKTIDDSDVVTLMKRQRQTNATTTPFALAQKYLPRELLQDLRMAAPPKPKKGS